jgi:hypothetical protein
MTNEAPLLREGRAQVATSTVMDLYALLLKAFMKAYKAAGELNLLNTKQQTHLVRLQADSIKDVGYKKLIFTGCSAAVSLGFSATGAYFGTRASGKRIGEIKTHSDHVTRPQQEMPPSRVTGEVPAVERAACLEPPTTHHSAATSAAHVRYMKGDAFGRAGGPVASMLDTGSHTYAAVHEAEQRTDEVGSQVYGRMAQTSTSNRSSGEELMRQAETAAAQRNNSEISIMEVVANNTRV